MADPIWLQKLKKLLSGESSAGYSAPRTGIQTSVGPMSMYERNIQHEIHKDDPGTSGYPHLPSGLHPSIESGYGIAPTAKNLDLWDRGKSGYLSPSFKSKPVMAGAGKKGLSGKNFWKAVSELKQPTGMPFGKGSRNVGGSGIKPSDMAQGVDAASLAANVNPKKRFWEQGLWRGIMG